MATISTDIRMTMRQMSPLVAAAARWSTPGHGSSFEEFARFVDGHYARVAAHPRYEGNRAARRRAAAVAGRA